jgi:hypothetical protein
MFDKVIGVNLFLHVDTWFQTFWCGIVHFASWETPMLDISMQYFSFCILRNQFKTFLCGKVHFACWDTDARHFDAALYILHLETSWDTDARYFDAAWETHLNCRRLFARANLPPPVLFWGKVLTELGLVHAGSRNYDSQSLLRFPAWTDP